MIHRETGKINSVARRIVQRIRTDVFRLFVGDRLGLIIFLSSLITYIFCWRIGVFITDTYAIANGLVAVADGHLWVNNAVYGPEAATAGMQVAHGNYYARNYGQIVTALPFLWLLQSVTAVVPLPIAVSAVWSLLLLALADQVGTLFDRRQSACLGAGVIGLVLFVGNGILATPIDRVVLPLVALEVQTMISGALTAVVLYRLLSHVHSQRTGTFAGLVTGLATPIGFWALSPKRHALGGLLIVTLVYTFHRSRSKRSESDSQFRTLKFRVSAYILVGVWAWVHSAEALLLLLALILIDIPTAPNNDPQTLAVIAIGFGLSLVPFLTTNTLISGNPVVPPRMLEAMREPLTSAGSVHVMYPSYSVNSQGFNLGRQSASNTFPIITNGAPIESNVGFSDESESRFVLGGYGAVLKILLEVLSPIERLLNQLVAGATILITQPNRVIAIFLKSGSSPRVGSELAQSTNLTIIETTPIVAGFIGAVIARVDRISRRLHRPVEAFYRSPVPTSHLEDRQITDLFVAVIVLEFVLMYLPRLPIHAQITVRYLVPVVPLMVYAVARTEPVRECLDNAQPTVYWSWALGVFVGLLFVADVIVIFDLTRAEAMQLHAWISIGLATLIVIVIGLKPRHRSNWSVAVGLGLTAAAGTIFLLLSGLDYFDYAGRYTLPIIREVTSSITLV